MGLGNARLDVVVDGVSFSALARGRGAGILVVVTFCVVVVVVVVVIVVAVMLLIVLAVVFAAAAAAALCLVVFGDSYIIADCKNVFQMMRRLTMGPVGGGRGKDKMEKKSASDGSTVQYSTWTSMGRGVMRKQTRVN